VEHAPHVVEYLGHDDAAADEHGVGRLDVEDGELQSLPLLISLLLLMIGLQAGWACSARCCVLSRW
jgi:hypothetical protein